MHSNAHIPYHSSEPFCDRRNARESKQTPRYPEELGVFQHHGRPDPRRVTRRHRDVIATQRTSSQSPLQTRLQLSLANKHHRESARGSDFANPGSFPQKKKKRNRTATQKRRDFDKSRNEIEQPKQFQKYWAESCTDRFPAPRFSFFSAGFQSTVSRLRF